jgi:hypothetical protein
MSKPTNMKSTNIALTRENADKVDTIICIAAPEWGSKKFNYQAEDLVDGEKADTVGTGSNSKVLFEKEYKFWTVASFK